jgi:TetR/AcrR family transcriptional regulator, transcriptional repressor of aconitase
MSARGRPSRPARIGRPPSAHRPPGFTRDQLVKAAADVFGDKGFESATLQEIASRAGVTSATVYRHFESKADLLLCVVEQAIRAMPLAERLAGSDTLTSREFARLVSSYADPGLASLRRLAIEIHGAASRDPEAGGLLRDLNERTHQSLSTKLAECMEAGGLPADLDADRVASLLVVLIMGLAHLETLAPGRIGDEEWIAFLESSVGDLLTRSTWRRK